MEAVIPRFDGVHLRQALADMLTSRRKAARLTQTELANRLARPQSYVASLESGQRRVEVVELLTLASAVGFSAADLVEELIANSAGDRPPP